MGHAKRIWYLSPVRAANVQASLCIRAVSPEPPLLAHTSSESRGTFRQEARFLALLNGWACAVKICHDGMLEDTNSLDGAQMIDCKDGSPLHLVSIVRSTRCFRYCQKTGSPSHNFLVIKNVTPQISFFFFFSFSKCNVNFDDVFFVCFFFNNPRINIFLSLSTLSKFGRRTSRCPPDHIPIPFLTLYSKLWSKTLMPMQSIESFFCTVN